MPRPLRLDAPGYRYHVVNRSHHGLALFEERRAQRVFLARLACAVRAKRIRVHAFCLMRNHYHLLVESLDGDISTTLQLLQGPFALWFNHAHDHKGHVFGGRFKCFRIRDGRYLLAVIRYIDRNPVEVRPGLDPLTYGPGSARLHVQEGGRPLWLDRGLIDGLLAGELAQGHDRREAYRRTFRLGEAGIHSSALIEARLHHTVPDEDDLPALWGASPAEWATWLRARGADRARLMPPLPVADVASVVACHEAWRLRQPGATLAAGRGPRFAVWPVLLCGSLRDLAGQRWADLARHAGVDEATARRRYERHRRAITEDAAYAALAVEVARESVKMCFSDVGVAGCRQEGAGFVPDPNPADPKPGR